jgi:hypothetical protein
MSTMCCVALTSAMMLVSLSPSINAKYDTLSEKDSSSLAWRSMLSRKEHNNDNDDSQQQFKKLHEGDARVLNVSLPAQLPASGSFGFYFEMDSVPLRPSKMNAEFKFLYSLCLPTDVCLALNASAMVTVMRSANFTKVQHGNNASLVFQQEAFPTDYVKSDLKSLRTDSRYYVFVTPQRAENAANVPMQFGFRIQASYPTSPEAWKIALLVIGCIVVLAFLIVAVVRLRKRMAKPDEEQHYIVIG